MNRQELEDVFSPKDECSICGSPYNDEEGGIQGWFGILPVTFCISCLSSTVDMVVQMQKDGELNVE